MNPHQDIEKALTMCQDSAARLRNLAQTESSQNSKMILLDAAHHLDVAAAECNYAAKST